MRKVNSRVILKVASRKAREIKARSYRHPNVRRAFKNFSTEEAWTFVVRQNGVRRFCRVHRTSNSELLANRQRLVLELFHKLYPKNSLTPVGIMKVPAEAILGYYPEEFHVSPAFSTDSNLHASVQRSTKLRIKGIQKYPVWGVVTEIERRQSPAFKVHQRELRGFVSKNSLGSKAHDFFIDRFAVPVANNIFKESGIRVDYTGNISNVKGNPLFFEPKITAPNRLIDFIKTKPKSEQVSLLRIVRELNLV